MKPQLTRLAVTAACLAWVPACHRAEHSGPPVLHLGRDQCAECGMILSEDRFAAALLTDQDGERSPLVFDDIGCMLDYRNAHENQDLTGGFVHDYADRRWLPAADAWYVTGAPGAPVTPMGSGLLAFATPEGAARQQAQTGGEVVDYRRLIETRIRSNPARHPGRDGSP